MTIKFEIIIACLLLAIHVSRAADKWSRQLEATGPGSETYDWIPVAQPIDEKERAGRVLTYQQNFPPNAAFGDHQTHHHVSPSQQVQPFGFPFHFQRFQQPQTQPLASQPLISQPQLHPQQPIQQPKLNLHPQQPTSQSFFKFEMPYNRDSNRNQDNSQGVQTGYQIQHSSFGSQQPLFQTTLVAQKQFFPPEFHPLQRPQQTPQSQQTKPVQQNFIEEPLKTFRDPNPILTQSNLQSTITPAPSFPVQQPFELQKPASFQSKLPYHASVGTQPSPSTNIQQDKEVQLLYVPYDTLYNQQRHENPAFENSRYNTAPHQQVNPYQINNFYMPEVIHSHIPNKFTTSTTAKPTTTTFKPSTVYQNLVGSQYTTVKPKLKAHQPPLAMFLFKSSNYPTKVDVVNALKNAKTIAVLDAPTQQAPTVFVGPAGMQTPNGYAKFELPYLSQLTQSNNIADIHFFVAPLSYRTPAGFNKILLPEPHVGSIVINKQKDTYNDLKSSNSPLLETIPQIDVNNQGQYVSQLSSASQNDNYGGDKDEIPTSLTSAQRNSFNGIRDFNQPSQNQHIFITPNQNDIQEISSTTPRVRPETTQRIKSTTPRQYFPEIVREVPKLNRNRFPYEVTTQRQPIPYRGNKYSEISTNKSTNPETLHEVTSPKIYKQERIKPNYQSKRPESQYAQFRPIPNNIPAEDFYKVQPIRTSTPPTTSSSPSTTTTTSTTSPRTYYTQTYPTSPQISFQSTRGQVYHSNNEATHSTTAQLSNNAGNEDHFTTTLISQQYQPSEEEHRMKQYFRQQDAFRNRSPFQSITPRPTVENIPYTPISVDYDREVKIPSTTPTYTSSSKPTLKQKITYYHPTTSSVTYEENSNTVPANEQIFEFSRDRDIQTTTLPPPEIVIGQAESTTIKQKQKTNSKQIINHSDSSTTDTSDVEYEPNPYQLPSELPPLTPNLPGLVNGLIEHNKLAGGETETTIQMDSATTPTPDTRPTRRLINRMKKPIVSKVSQSVSYSSSDYSTRRPINRIRRPYTGRNNTSTSTTTMRPSSSRSPIIRNPNRIRYNPTPEERQTLRLKSKKHGSSGKKDDNSDDLEYQRDVLKQNYPVFRPSTKKPTTAHPPSPSTEIPAHEKEEIYTVPPTSEHNFEGLIEPMQIAQQYQEYPQNNYGPGYFPNEEEILPTEAALRNEISPIYTASSTAEEPQPTTRRPPFIRRGSRIKTTTEIPTTTTTNPTSDANEEHFTTRTKVTPRRVVRVRARTRRPHPASSTITPSEDTVESEPQKNNFNKLNRFNQELYQDEIAQRRQRIKSQFHLEPQESQWSPSLSGKSINSFQPLKLKDHPNVTQSYENEPEIVTARADVEKSDSYVFNVSAGFGPTANTHFTSKIMNNKTLSPLKKNEKSFADLLVEVMSDIDKKTDDKSPDSSYFESQKTDNHPIRRGKWKNSNTGESFETAESQNIGAQFFNSLYTGTIEKATESMLKFEDMYATTPLPEEISPTSTTASQLTLNESTPNVELTTTQNSATEQITEDSIDNVPTFNQPETITRRIDDLWNVEDLDSQPSMFSEVRKQLNELFKTTENDSENEKETMEFIQPHKHEYTDIHRLRTATESSEIAEEAKEKSNIFHENLMESVVYATSTSSKNEMSETEICYRGHCIRSEDLPPNHKLH